MSNPTDPTKSFEDKSADTPSTRSETPKPPRGLLFELLMKATREYDATLAEKRWAQLKRWFPRQL
jgi:hypothetical protein